MINRIVGSGGNRRRRFPVTSAVAVLIGAIVFSVFGVAAASGRTDVSSGSARHAATRPARAASHARPSARPAAHRSQGFSAGPAASSITRSLFGTVVTSFEDNDGNLVHDSVMDWNDFGSPTWNGTAPNQNATTTNGGWTFYGVSDAITSNDSTYAGGVKQADVCPSIIPLGSTPNKADLARIYIAGRVNPANNHVELVFAWVRAPQNTTSSDVHVAFEFNQSSTTCAAGSGSRPRRALVHPRRQCA